MKICILSLYKSENLGEMAYTECLRKIISKSIPGVEIQLIDIHGRDAEHPMKKDLLTRVLKKLHLTTLEKAHIFASENKFLKKYYACKVKGAKGVIIPGGGYIKCTPKSKKDRKYRYNDYFDIMAKVCEKENIGLYYNAVGHTINENEEKEIQNWKNTFSRPAVKYVSCRDELDFFKTVYKDAELVCCSAAYSAELFDLHKEKDSNTIGIGVIRPDAFRDYGFSITEQELEEFYAKLIKLLFDRGFEVKLFTNGLTSDYIFGQKIANLCGGSDILIERPVTINELLETISKFKGIIVSRMHAAIIAYSFDIPAVCLCWNNKHLGFMSGAGVPERAIYPNNFTAEYVVEVLENALGSGWPEEQKTVYRTTAIKSVEKIISGIKMQ